MVVPMPSASKVALVLSYQFPGRYALNVLAGAVEAAEGTHEVALHFPRDRDSLLAATSRCLDEGTAWSSPGRREAVWSLEAPPRGRGGDRESPPGPDLRSQLMRRADEISLAFKNCNVAIRSSPRASDNFHKSFQ
jgi:hypothetical protein